MVKKMNRAEWHSQAIHCPGMNQHSCLSIFKFSRMLDKAVEMARIIKSGGCDQLPQKDCACRACLAQHFLEVYSKGEA